MKNLKNLLLLPLLALCLVACKDDDADMGAPTIQDRTFHYATIVSSAQDSQELVLDSLSTAVKDILNVPEWLKVTSKGLNSNGHPVLLIENEAVQPNEERPEATLVLNFDYGNKVKLTIIQSMSLQEDENGINAAQRANIDFIENWEVCDTIVLFTTRSTDKFNRKYICTPWSFNSEVGVPHVEANIHQDIQQDHLREDGWRMAICNFIVGSDNQANNAYFGLYNIYTGKLRMYHYIQTASDNSNDYNVRLQWKKFDSNGHYGHMAFLGAYPFAFPISHAARLNSGSINNVLSGNYENSLFVNRVSPLTRGAKGNGDNAMTSGWYCYDIDLSGFVDGYSALGNTRAKNDLALNYSVSTTNLTRLELYGAIQGTIDGTFENPYDVTTLTGAGRICKYLSQGSSIAKSMSGAIKSIESYMKKKQEGEDKKEEENKDNNTATTKASPRIAVSTVVGAVGAVASVASSVIKTFWETETTEHHSGVINMGLNAKINLSGTAFNYTGNKVTPLDIAGNSFFSSSHVGEGIIGIEEPPVVYVVKDKVLVSGVNNNVIVKKTGQNSYELPVNGKNMNMRLVQFFDPRSVKIRLNDNVFENIKDIQVRTYYGVYTSEALGFAANYRSTIGMPAGNATLSLLPQGGGNGIYSSKKGQFAMQPVFVEAEWPESTLGEYYWTSEDKLVNAIPTTNEAYRVDSESAMKVSGYNVGLGNIEFLTSPSVGLPLYSGNSSKCKNAVLPDYAVIVEVCFTTKDPIGGERKHILTRRLQPEIKQITTAEAKVLYNQLQTYCEDCQDGSAINNIKGAHSMEYPAFHPYGDEIIKKEMIILKKITQ